MSARGSNTSKRILDAAESLVLNRGFSATSVDAIQEKAEISRGTFFYHFPTKDDLSRALVERYAKADFELVTSFMQRAEKLVGDPAQQLIVFISLHEEFFENLEGTYPGCLFASYTYEAGLFDERTSAVVNDSVEHWRTTVGGKIEEAILAHTPRRPVVAVDLADHAYGVLQGAFILSRLKNDDSIIIDQLKLLRTMIEILFDLSE